MDSLKELNQGTAFWTPPSKQNVEKNLWDIDTIRNAVEVLGYPPNWNFVSSTSHLVRTVERVKKLRNILQQILQQLETHINWMKYMKFSKKTTKKNPQALTSKYPTVERSIRQHHEILFCIWHVTSLLGIFPTRR